MNWTCPTLDVMLKTSVMLVNTNCECLFGLLLSYHEAIQVFRDLEGNCNEWGLPLDCSQNMISTEQEWQLMQGVDTKWDLNFAQDFTRIHLNISIVRSSIGKSIETWLGYGGLLLCSLFTVHCFELSSIMLPAYNLLQLSQCIYLVVAKKRSYSTHKYLHKQ